MLSIVFGFYGGVERIVFKLLNVYLVIDGIIDIWYLLFYLNFNWNIRWIDVSFILLIWKLKS